MPTTVRVSQEAHTRILRLQERYQRQLGQRLAQSDLVDRALAYAERHVDAFIEESGWRPWDPEKVERFLDTLPTFDGPSDLSQDIDSWVYGGKSKRSGTT